MDHMVDDPENEEVVLSVEATLDVLPPYVAELALHVPADGPRSATLKHLPNVKGEQRRHLETWAETTVLRFCDRGYDGTWQWDPPDENLAMMFTKDVGENDLQS
jgi:hypothetical protein